ncbi:hypothetical protein FB554_0475 [Barrientosiimonas humi]|uniref:Polyketide cyclase/dehydrase/lipid transport protein n=1 Tax=Barrientosiimonas humi TaxID=999931 RepID=A0A542X937_9MICO|nr:SRPBCC family protein [Barrientosiimonas humi]TQL32351.1 hypothetical protein FB554_0475 [Barrientosiimonas humi]CAG7572342.1 hypothetical protein BH39T_PBIAJDOK_00956 [Barrientosiimonas humi]
MAPVRVVREVEADVQRLWQVVTDWPRHGDIVPLTEVVSDGSQVVGITGLGPLRFRDPMALRDMVPPEGDRPGSVRLEKQGAVLGGWAEIEVSALGPGRSRLVFTEEIWPRPDAVGKRLGAVATPLTRLFVRLLVDGLVRGAQDPPR